MSIGGKQDWDEFDYLHVDRKIGNHYYSQMFVELHKRLRRLDGERMLPLGERRHPTYMAAPAVKLWGFGPHVVELPKTEYPAKAEYAYAYYPYGSGVVIAPEVGRFMEGRLHETAWHELGHCLLYEFRRPRLRGHPERYQSVFGKSWRN